MGEDTQIMDKKNPIRAYLERRIGQIVFLAIPTGLLFLAGWIWTVERKIASIEASNKENEAQWKVLYENREKIEDLEIQVEVYKELFRMMVDPESKKEIIISNLRDREPIRTEPKRSPEKLHESKLEDFRQEQLRDMTRQMQAPNWKK